MQESSNIPITYWMKDKLLDEKPAVCCSMANHEQNLPAKLIPVSGITEKNVSNPHVHLLSVETE